MNNLLKNLDDFSHPLKFDTFEQGYAPNLEPQLPHERFLPAN